MTLFLAAWQFLVPGDTDSQAPSASLLVYTALIWISFPNAIVLASSASRSLWHERHRAAAFVPVPGFLACAVGLPVLFELIGMGRIAAVWAFPAGLMTSAGTSIAILLRSPVGAAAARELEDGDEPPAYARDVGERKR